MLKQINYFILSIFVLELISLLSGFGTHFEHYKYAIMLSVLFFNLIVQSVSIDAVLSKVKNKNRRGQIWKIY